MASVLVMVGSVSDANDSIKLSPALELYPGELIESLRICTGNDAHLGVGTRAADYVESWFREFRSPDYIQITSRVGKPVTEQYLSDLNHAHARVDVVRRLVDYRTEQALISMADAAVRRHRDMPGCQVTVSRLLLRIAAQRDRAWAWADAVDRLLRYSEDRWEVEVRKKRIAESLRRVERSYDQFDIYRK